ncbi:cadherin-like and PC-esterase domain-containing protein 1 [Anneissia japonica]|uniref:cadherin-like and PC-esterase domain-containing protein 1 n=1 Tax=Anneissia japonica TaxID=1529436 RepID=UPI0014258EEC|nr:cadherin-like and PC-esterase domain-containing protein 1 [Anneissia japonica]XP_033114619.1 cadherin-like and PC-esterase domain-containing protein 1 [Anneissia japonica]XP_033114620.1 cadherin-like and PC-esterase domain-containing protein 1 [Anneissia japonica]
MRWLSRKWRLRRLPKCDILYMLLALGMFSIYMMYNVAYHMRAVVGEEKKLSAIPHTRDKEEEDAGGGAGEIDSGGDFVIHRNILEGKEVEQKKDVEETTLSEFQIYLKELETRLLEKQRKLNKVAHVRGQLNLVQRDLPFYEAALRRNGFWVKTPDGVVTSKLTEQNGTILTNFEESPSAREFGVTDPNNVDPWVLMLCMTYSDGARGDCLQRETFRQLQDEQKINRIPGIRETLWKKDSFCSTMNAARRIPALRKSVISPVCWVLPAQYEQFLGVADALGTDVRWVVKSTTSGGIIQLLQPTRDRDFAKVKQYSKKTAVVQQYFPNPLLVFGMPVSIRAHVVVTSVAPLTAFIHSQGTVHYRQDYQKHFMKIKNRMWSFSQFKNYLIEHHGKNAAEIAFKNMESVIVQTLLAVESSVAEHFNTFSFNRNKPYKCKNCFQLLGFDLIFNSTLHPVIIEVNGHPYLDVSKEANEWAASETRQTIIDDTINILFSNSSVAIDVAEALETLHLNIGIVGLNCQSSHQLCMTDEDLEYLMDSRRQVRHRGQFKQLYPSPENPKYNSLVKDLVRFQNAKQKRKPREPLPNDKRHSTPDLHPVITAVESFFHSKQVEADQKYFQQRSIVEEFSRSREDVQPIHDVFEINNPYKEKYKKTHCSKDHQTMPYLSGIYFEPNISFSPEFDPYTTEYYAKVPYKTVILKVWAHSMNCDCEVRLEDKYGLSRPANYTIGIGDNRVNLLVVDITHTEPWVINTYVVHVYREGPSEHKPEFNENAQHQVCSLMQECNLKFIPFASCGLNPMPHDSWPAFLQQANHLPLCKAGDSPGQWVMPCGMCSDRSTCFFRNAKWQPHTCRHDHMTREKLQECMARKRMVFMGDSTNRGIMYYIMEQVNGSLTEWDKTHDIKVYNNLNRNRTSTTFGYFPQFMIPANQRPPFDKAFLQVLQKAMPLENNENTVIVIGGVHWLATHHLNMVQDVLKREGLSDVTIIMKGLGAGFHQPVDGIHYLTPKEQYKVLLHNQGLIQHAKTLGFEIVDTFNITMARYRDFLQGKCSCHFHKVQEIVGTTPGSLPQPPQTKRVKIYRRGMTEDTYNYHVHGDINALYSEILLNRICDL